MQVFFCMGIMRWSCALIFLSHQKNGHYRLRIFKLPAIVYSPIPPHKKTWNKLQLSRDVINEQYVDINTIEAKQPTSLLVAPLTRKKRRGRCFDESTRTSFWRESSWPLTSFWPQRLVVEPVTNRHWFISDVARVASRNAIRYPRAYQDVTKPQELISHP